MRAKNDDARSLSPLKNSLTAARPSLSRHTRFARAHRPPSPRARAPSRVGRPFFSTSRKNAWPTAHRCRPSPGEPAGRVCCRRTQRTCMTTVSEGEGAGGTAQCEPQRQCARKFQNQLFSLSFFPLFFPSLFPSLFSLSFFPLFFPSLFSLSFFPLFFPSLFSLSFFPLFFPSLFSLSFSLSFSPPTPQHRGRRPRHSVRVHPTST